MDYGDTSQTEYNLNEIKATLIGKQQILATNFYIRRNYLDCFQCWKSIRLLINNRLSPKEKKICKALEKFIFEKGGKFVKGNFIKNQSFIPILERYIEGIGENLRKMGLDITDKGEEDLF